LFQRYQKDPAAYATDVLKVAWWRKQNEIAMALTQPPYKVLVKAAHSVGKTFLMGGIISWWFDCFSPSIALTTAPSDRQVRDLLWKEIRVQRAAAKLGGFLGPKVPRLERTADHFAHGFTTKEAEAFQGHHGPHVMIAFDEAVGVHRMYWETAATMFAGEGHAWLCIFNPTDLSSQAYAEEQTGNWKVITVSALDHPNIAAELAGLPPPYPSAIRLARLDEMLRQWCTPVQGKHNATDIEWPPGSRKWLRPGPIAEARLLGRWPSQGTYGVWSDADWIAATTPISVSLAGLVPQIGCDVARFGDDWTCIHSRCGPVSLSHQSVNGWGTDQTAGTLKATARDLGSRFRVNPKVIPILIDDNGVGGGVVDQREDYNFIPVNGQWKAHHQTEYPNRRSELWFSGSLAAREGRMSLASLPASTLHEIRRQAMAPVWKMDAQGRRVVEKKEDTKEKTGRSPDDMDAINLAYSDSQMIKAPAPLVLPQRRAPHDIPRGDRSGSARRGMWGCGQRPNDESLTNAIMDGG
jgi:hypothetical protein